MARHEEGERIDVRLDISKILDLYQEFREAFQALSDEIDRSVIEAGYGRLEKRKNGGLGRRTTDKGG